MGKKKYDSSELVFAVFVTFILGVFLTCISVAIHEAITECCDKGEPVCTEKTFIEYDGTRCYRWSNENCGQWLSECDNGATYSCVQGAKRLTETLCNS